MREKRDLYDSNGNLTGITIEKGEPKPKNRYIYIVIVFIQNSKGEFLIQKRSKNKDGKYGTTGGHLKTKENSIQGIIREIKEEIGLLVKEEELERIYSGRSDKYQTIFDIYYLKKDCKVEQLKIQKEEVESINWYPLNKIEKIIKEGNFLENHAEKLSIMIEYLNRKCMFHKVKKVESLENYKLKVVFECNVIKYYDIKPLLEKRKGFEMLKEKKMFSKVYVDKGGYGISWNDKVDLSCEELWNSGKES